MSNTFSKEFSISSFDLNPKGQARLTTMANFFQEMAYHHANQLGFGYDDMKEKQTFWVLSRMRIRIDQYPVWDEKVRVETWHRGMDRIFGLRDFRVENSSGDLMGMASTAWLILDSRTRRPVRLVDEVLLNSIGDGSVFKEGLEKIVLPEKMVELSQHKVLFSDLDIVGHVNNVKYMEWCIDAAIDKDQTDSEIQKLEINFTHEATLGDEIEIRGASNQNSDSYFLARRIEDDKEIFRACLTWK
jgi:acyl-ACP thioesterase